LKDSKCVETLLVLVKTDAVVTPILDKNDFAWKIRKKLKNFASTDVAKASITQQRHTFWQRNSQTKEKRDFLQTSR
jgi:hypothetical protein